VVLKNKYCVEVWDRRRKKYRIHSYHKNRLYAEIQAEIKKGGGDKVRLVYDGQVLTEWKPEDSVAATATAIL